MAIGTSNGEHFEDEFLATANSFVKTPVISPKEELNQFAGAIKTPSEIKDPSKHEYLKALEYEMEFFRNNQGGDLATEPPGKVEEDNAEKRIQSKPERYAMADMAPEGMRIPVAKTTENIKQNTSGGGGGGGSFPAPKTEKIPETIDKAAVKFGNGEVLTGHSHFKIIQQSFDKGLDKHLDKATDGFVTSTGRFVNRVEAQKIFDAAKQEATSYAPKSKGFGLTSEGVMKIMEDAGFDREHLIREVIKNKRPFPTR